MCKMMLPSSLCTHSVKLQTVRRLALDGCVSAALVMHLGGCTRTGHPLLAKRVSAWAARSSLRRRRTTCPHMTSTIAAQPLQCTPRTSQCGGATFERMPATQRTCHATATASGTATLQNTSGRTCVRAQTLHMRQSRAFYSQTPLRRLRSSMACRRLRSCRHLLQERRAAMACTTLQQYAPHHHMCKRQHVQYHLLIVRMKAQRHAVNHSGSKQAQRGCKLCAHMASGSMIGLLLACQQCWQCGATCTCTHLRCGLWCRCGTCLLDRSDISSQSPSERARCS